MTYSTGDYGYREYLEYEGRKDVHEQQAATAGRHYDGPRAFELLYEAEKQTTSRLLAEITEALAIAGQPGGELLDVVRELVGTKP